MFIQMAAAMYSLGHGLCTFGHDDSSINIVVVIIIIIMYMYFTAFFIVRFLSALSKCQNTLNLLLNATESDCNSK